MRMLVSVRDVAEAREAVRAGVDLIDLKEPAAGALGGLALPVIREVVAALRPECRFEIVLVDDGSDDGTGDEFLQRCTELGSAARLIRHEKSVGQSTALSAGCASPNTTACAKAGSPRSAVSTHSGETLRPKAVMSTCLRRPRTCTKPSASMWPRSPVGHQEGGAAASPR